MPRREAATESEPVAQPLILLSGQGAEAECANCGPILVTNTTKGEYTLRAGQWSQCPLCAPPKTFGVPKNGLRASRRDPVPSK